MGGTGDATRPNRVYDVLRVGIHFVVDCERPEMKNENVARVWLQECLAAALPRLKMVKNHQSALSGAGLPDTFYQQAHLGGVHLEFKYMRTGGFDWSKQPTKLQKQTLRELWIAGANVGVIVYSAEWGTWCSVHGEDLIATFDAEQMWPCDEASGEYWAMCIAKDALRGYMVKETLARLVWGRTWD